MAATRPFVRQAGSGRTVVCLHSNASSSSQWRDLMNTLSAGYQVLAPDSYGAGKSIDWPSDTVISLSDEVDFIEPVLDEAGDAFSIVGHSYGAAVALMTALRHPQRVRALALYEPTLFSLVDADASPPNAADGIRQAVSDAGAALDRGLPDEAARHFIDYWMGTSSWDKTPAARKGPIAASIVNVRRWGHALHHCPTPLEAFRSLNMPVLCMVGNNSQASALRVTQLLATVLPRVEIMPFDGLGHMGPVTNPEPVNRTITAFLSREFPARNP